MPSNVLPAKEKSKSFFLRCLLNIESLHWKLHTFKDWKHVRNVNGRNLKVYQIWSGKWYNFYGMNTTWVSDL